MRAAAVAPTPSIATSVNVPPRPGTNVWWYSSDTAKRIEKARVNATTFRDRDPVSLSMVASVSAKTTANSVACQPFTIANQLYPQKEANFRKDASSLKTCAAIQAKKSCGRMTVLDVPTMRPPQEIAASAHSQGTGDHCPGLYEVPCLMSGFFRARSGGWQRLYRNRRVRTGYNIRL